MDAERIIAEIEWLEKLFRLPDKRSLLIPDWKAAKRKIAAIERLEKLYRLPDPRTAPDVGWNDSTPEV